MTAHPLSDFDTCECGDYRLNHVKGRCGFHCGCGGGKNYRRATEIPEAWQALADTREGPDE